MLYFIPFGGNLEVGYHSAFFFFPTDIFIYLNCISFELKESDRKVKINYPSSWRMKSLLCSCFMDTMPMWL